MGLYLILTILITISAFFAYLNNRYIRMPFVIGLFFLSTLLSLAILACGFWDMQQYAAIRKVVRQVDISKLVLEIMLGFLLFAGSFHTRWLDIRSQIRPITFFAVCGVLCSTIIIGGLLYYTCQLLQVPVSVLHCLIFGALISPTDPIAVLGILTKANVPRKIESTIVGESLFNDGVGVVVFIALLQTLQLGRDTIDFGQFGLLFLQEAIGGVLSGLVLGYGLHRLLKSIDNYETEVLLTIAFVMAGYSTCLYFHLSAPLAMVIMGLFVGNYKQKAAMSDQTLEYVHKFWELLDVVLNAILFILIAFVLVVIDFKVSYLIISALTVLIVLLSRILIVFLPRLLLPGRTGFSSNESKILVWGGLRGGLSLALVLSLPESEAKNLLLVITYSCVVFSILVQGLTIGKLAKRLLRSQSAAAPAGSQ
ncbi:MAG: sodium:proton antiporter [Chitinophagaceae bacterium]|nr:sodium:proton antiporter [Chitinophagaceae bacterium]